MKDHSLKKYEVKIRVSQICKVAIEAHDIRKAISLIEDEQLGEKTEEPEVVSICCVDAREIE